MCYAYLDTEFQSSRELLLTAVQNNPMVLITVPHDQRGDEEIMQLIKQFYGVEDGNMVNKLHTTNEEFTINVKKKRVQ